jgi:O-antigen ligase/tetratricopeptide (TPR) repeat protein
MHALVESEHVRRPKDWLLHVVDFGIFGVVFVAPLFMAGRGPVGKFVFVIFVCLAGLAWALRQCLEQRSLWRPSGAEWLLLAALSLVLLQLVPLSPPMLATLSPASDDLLPLWTLSDAALSLPTWSTVSLSPEATRGGLVVFLGYALLFWILVQRIDSLASVQRLLKWIALATIAMACLGLVQFLGGNGKFLWVFEHPSRDTFHVVKGSFHNQNHFAHMLALGIGPVIWLLWRSQSNQGRKHAVAVGLGVVAVAGLLSFSRGGVIAIALAGVTCASIYLWKSLIGKRACFAAVAMGVLIAAALCIHGYEPLAKRLATLRDSRSLEEVSHGRKALWTALSHGIPDFVVLGAGIGSHREVYPIYMKKHFNVEFTHGESGYLQLLLEAGVPGLLLMLSGIGLCFAWCLSSLFLRFDSTDRHAGRNVPIRSKHHRNSAADRLQYSASFGAILPGFVASTVHSVGDFVWYVSACMSTTVILAACACRLYQLMRNGEASLSAAHQVALLDGRNPKSRSSGRVRSRSRARFKGLFAGHLFVLTRPVSVVVAASVAAAAVVMISHLQPAAFAAPQWNAYRRTALSTLASGATEQADEHARLDKMSRFLESTLASNPDDPRANMRYARVCLRRFELEQRHALNPMTVAQIREAALASRFVSKEAQAAWLDVAVGDNIQLLERALHHSWRGLQACPLQGEGYVYLSELSFLEGPDSAAKHSYLAQAQRVRPHSGQVLFAVGQEAILSGDLPRTLASWRRAFHQDPDIQALIVESFAPQVPAKYFLECFSPDTDGLGRLFHFYRNLNRNDDLRFVADRYVTSLEQEARATRGKPASDTWHQAQSVYSYLGAQNRALVCEKRAVELDPRSFSKRRTLAVLLVDNAQHAAAIEQLRWCLRRRPDAVGLSELLDAATRMEARQRPSAAADQPAARPLRR